MNITTDKIKPYSKVIVLLLKGVVESKSSRWDDIFQYEDEIREYLSVIGLELIYKKEDGYAFLKQVELDEDESTIGLVSRRKLSFGASVVMVILRQILEEFERDIDAYETQERFITEEELKSEIEDFLPQDYDKVKFYGDLEKNISRISDLGYLNKTVADNGETVYSIHKIIKEKVTLDTLLKFKQNLENYGL